MAKLKSSSLFIILCSILIVVYFFTRLFHLIIIPVFADEAIYIRWAQVMRAVSSLRFLPLSDGKQPFFMWLIIPFLKIIQDPLIAGRIVSVLAGFGTMVGIFILSLKLFKNKFVSLFALIFYLISPFTMFFDRMALADGLLSCFGIWFLVFSIKLINNLRFDLAILAGITLGLALITKSPALIFAILLPLTLIILPSYKKLTFKLPIIINKSHILAVGKLFVLWGIVYLFAYSIYNILRLGPEFHMIAIRNKDYVFSLSEIIKHPLNPLVGNLKSVFSWYWTLLTPIVFVIGVIGICLSIKKYTRRGILLFLFWILPILAQSAIAKVYTSRYVLFTVPIFLIFSAITCETFFSKIKSKFIVIFGLTIIFILPIYQITLLLINPQKAWLPRYERNGYLELWTSGFGIKESSVYIKEIAKTQKVLVGTEGYFGTLPDGLQIYLEKVPNITIIGVGYPIKEVPMKLKNSLIDNKVFLLVNDSRFMPPSMDNYRLIAKYPKAINYQTGKQENLLFFEIIE